MAGASLNDLSRAGFRQYSRVSSTNIDAAADGSGKAPRTDIGTLVIHWTVTIACIITLVTGLRLASDQEFSLVWRAIAPVLPQGEIWSWHIISGLALYFASTAYAVYMFRSGLKRRVALAKVRALTMPVPRKTKWGAVNVLLHWALYGLLLIQTVTGFLLYLGHGGWWVTIHSFTATAVLIYIVAHSISHFCYGGLQQLLRLFRPSALVRTKATRSRPFLIAASVGSVVAASLVLADYGTLDELPIRAIEAREAPKLDGVMDEAMWKTARPVYRAHHAGRRPQRPRRVEGRDPRRARRQEHLLRLPLGGPEPVAAPPADDQEGGRLAHPRQQPGHRRRHDLLRGQVRGSVLALRRFRQRRLDPHGREAARRQAGAAEPARLSLHHRRLDPRHVAVEGLARRPPRLRRRQYIVRHRRSRAEMEAAGQARYQAGYWGDPGRASYTYNFKIEPGHKGPAPVQRLPKDLAANAAAPPASSYDPDSIDLESSRWWMTPEESDPYSPELDARIPLGTMHPGRDHPVRQLRGDRGHVHGGAKWKDGHWTLETVRALDTGSPVRHRLRRRARTCSCGSRSSTTPRPAIPATCDR